MATSKHTTKNALNDVSWSGTVENCRQVISLIQHMKHEDFDEQEAMGLNHICHLVNDALAFELDREAGKQ